MGKHIIEFIGPPGVGKSSIYRSLCQQWNANCAWIHQDELIAPRPSIRNFTEWLEFNYLALLGRRRGKGGPMDNGLRFIQNHKELAALCWDHLSNPLFFNEEAVGKRYRAIYYLLHDFYRYQAILESACEHVCIIDEGFLQKSFLIHDDEAIMLAFIRRYLQLVPLPHAIVYIDTPDKELIAERLRSRKKSLPPQLAKNPAALLAETEKWQQFLQLVLGLMEKESVIIHRIDAARPIRENVQLLNQFLTCISTKSES
jgi:thymidylate kinase